MNEDKIQDALNSTTPKSGDSDVDRILDEQQSGVIKEVYHSDKSKKVGVGYKHLNLKMNVETPTKTKTNVPEDIYRRNNMSDFNIVKEGQNLGVIDSEGRIVVNDTIKATFSVSCLMKLMVIHFPQVKVVLDNIKPRKNTLVFDKGEWGVGVGDFKSYLTQFFPDDINVIKGRVNTSDILKSFKRNISDNSCRKESTGLVNLTMQGKTAGSTKTYHFDARICSLTFDQLSLLMANTKKTAISNTKVRNLFKDISTTAPTSDKTQAPAEKQGDEKITLSVVVYKEMCDSLIKYDELFEEVIEIKAKAEAITKVQNEQSEGLGLDLFITKMNDGDKFTFTYEKAPKIASSDE